METMKITITCFIVSLLLTAYPSFALVGVDSQGTWPESWPEELEAFRAGSRTISVATGIQENIYEIPHISPVELRKIWPAVLKVKTPGAPLILSSVTKTFSSLTNSQGPTIRIYGPSRGACLKPVLGEKHKEPPKLKPGVEIKELVEKGALFAGPPWPESIQGPNGELPEYVYADWVDARLEWLPVKADGKSDGFKNRARVDIELVVDGEVIDLNRTPLPRNTPIIDKRVGIQD